MDTRISYILLIVITAMFSGCVEMGGEEKVITGYQCYNGQVVSYLNECPQPNVETTVSTGSSCPPCPTICPTTIPCECPGVQTTTSLPPKLGPLCNEDGDCGSASYGTVRCHNGDAYRTKNTPKCDLDEWDNQKHCKTLSELELVQECGENQRCVTGQGCVAYSEED